MSEPFEHIAGLDKLVHEPARLSILTALSACKKANFLYLRRLTGLTKGNLSSHLGKLEDAELVDVSKKFKSKKPVTYVTLRAPGRKAVDDYWERMESLRSDSENWQPGE